MHDLRRRYHFVLWILAATCIWLAPAAAPQISPGQLARPHEFLNGSTNCTTCHKLAAGQATFRCNDCHTDIASRIATHKGLHATYNIKPGSSQECAKCHSDHNGEAFPLIKWDSKTFDHKQTGYVLEGKHAGLACNKCHSANNISPSERPAIKAKDLNKTFLGLSTSCVPCHQDEHKGRLDPNCTQCHNFEDWKVVQIRQFDHSKTRYPLTGLHAEVKCEKCHTPGPGNKPRYAGIPFNLCSDCHSDPHKGSFPQRCESCHSTSSWKRVSIPGVNEKFDHSKTKYPLMGKHQTVDCLQCHGSGDFKKPLAFDKCMNCHKPDPHNGQFAKRPGGSDCANCHTVEEWKPSTFMVKEHAASAYPLQGGHAKVECAECHIPKGKDTLFKVKFDRCTDCHSDQHAGQFAAAPYFNACDKCHTLDGYKPSTFTLAKHKETHFVLTGGHIAVPCGDCHKESPQLLTAAAKTVLVSSHDNERKPTEIYHWQGLSCASCHQDPHKGQFREHMLQTKINGAPAGCEACHSTKSWKDLTRFDHAKTSFPLVGAHRATACIDCHKPPNLGTRLIDVDFTTAPTKCEECHEDIHGKQFAKGGITPCADCHNSAKWKPSMFDHEIRTAFSLRGAHMNVKCGDCHKLMKTVEGKNVLFYRPTPKECAACHGNSIPQKS